MLQKNYLPAHTVVIMGLIDFSVPIMKDGAILGFIMAGQTKTEDTTIKPILPTQTRLAP